MFMAMMSAMQCNPVFKETYQRLLKIRKSKEISDHCVCEKNDCNTKFNG